MVFELNLDALKNKFIWKVKKPFFVCFASCECEFYPIILCLCDQIDATLSTFKYSIIALHIIKEKLCTMHPKETFKSRLDKTILVIQ